jgi:hypothetical protein
VFGLSILLTYQTSRFEPQHPFQGQHPFIVNQVRIEGDELFVDSLVLPLKTIPKVQELHTVAKSVVGRWAKLYTALKIEESGNDGQNSFYAKKYYNLVGMRFPRKRKTTAIRKGYDYYAVYENWYEGMVDFTYYIEYMERSFELKHGRLPKTEREFIKHIYGSYNVYSKWRNDMFYILKNFKYQ